MRAQFHILNGDALRQQFPKTIAGQIIVCRECLVDGDVSGENLDQLFQNRADFISDNYDGERQDYFDKVASQFQKVRKIVNSDINLWFEDDLFCQVNCWFVTSLIQKENSGNKVYLVRPRIHTRYSFGGMDQSELLAVYKDRQALAELDEISDLWDSYQRNDIPSIQAIAAGLKDKYPFISEAVEAHVQRLPRDRKPGRPIASLMTIMDELNTDEFAPIFREFCKRESIYGFGDLQVKRLYDQIVENKPTQ